MSKSKIEWTDTTWNPITGCTKISEGCRNCYAERMSKRLAGRCGYPKDDPFKVTVHSDKYLEPLTWRKPRRVFVNSMSDLFHQDVQDEWILAVFVAMGLTYEHTGEMKEISPGYKVGIHKSKHTFMILTKRPERMRNFINRLTSKEPDEEWDKKAHYYSSQLAGMNGAILPGNAIFTFSQWIQDGMPGLWLGVSIENQAAADERIPLLLQTPAPVRFISAEPLLGKIDIQQINEREAILFPLIGQFITDGMNEPWSLKYGGLDWVIVGGESGPGARPMHPDWVRSLRDQCKEAGTKFFFKQWGEWETFYDREKDDPDWDSIPEEKNGIQRMNIEGGHGFHGDRVVYIKRVVKKKAGRELDGRTWDELPDWRP